MEKHTIKAVHESDLCRLLSDLGLSDMISAGEAKCWFCGTVIKAENLYSLMPVSGDVKISCNTPRCVSKCIQWLGENT
jgi:hypothetical protein